MKSDFFVPHEKAVGNKTSLHNWYHQRFFLLLLLLLSTVLRFLALPSRLGSNCGEAPVGALRDPNLGAARPPSQRPHQAESSPGDSHARTQQRTALTRERPRVDRGALFRARPPLCAFGPRALPSPAPFPFFATDRRNRREPQSPHPLVNGTLPRLGARKYLVKPRQNAEPSGGLLTGLPESATQAVSSLHSNVSDKDLLAAAPGSQTVG